MKEISPHLTPDPEEFLPRLRDLSTAAALRETAWGEFVRWLYLEHFSPCLEARIYRRLEARGISGRVQPGDVFSRYCYRVRENPGLLGERPIPTRAWLSKGLENVARDLEKSIRRQLAAGSPQVDPVSSYLATPEAAILLRELETELVRELRRLEEENPTQHRAWALGVAGTRYQEISQQLETSVSNVKSLVRRARETLRARLEAYLRGEGGAA